MGGIYLGKSGQSIATIGCDYLPETSAFCRGSAVQGQGVGALMWSVAVPGCVGPEVSRVVQTKVSPRLCFASGTLPEL